MIGRLRGVLVERGDGQAILDVGGVGYEVFACRRTLERWASQDVEVIASVSTVVREDAITLYAFADREERDAFEVLIGVTGVGAKLAMASLDALGLPELRAAVEGGDVVRLCQIPGVGKRTAQRLALELQGKLPDVDFVPGAPVRAPAEDVFAMAMQALGWGRAETEAARQRLQQDGFPEDAPIADRVRAALRSSARS